MMIENSYVILNLRKTKKCIKDYHYANKDA